jgi:hypothetical protein
MFEPVLNALREIIIRSDFEIAEPNPHSISLQAFSNPANDVCVLLGVAQEYVVGQGISHQSISLRQYDESR